MSHSTHSDTPPSAEASALLTLLQLEAAARQIDELDAFPFFVVNETRKLLNYRQAVLVESGTKGMRVKAISSIATIDRNTPMLQWLENVLKELQKANPDLPPQQLKASTFTSELAASWPEFSLPYVAWSPLRTASGKTIGGLWLSRETLWNSNELALLERLAATYAHAWQALNKPVKKPLIGKQAWRYAAALLMLGFLIPVRLSALAPVEIVPLQPSVVSAPLDGVIADIAIEPNQSVEPEQLLLRYEDTVLRNDYLIAEKSLAVAQAEHLRAMQGAFMDDKSKADVALLKAKVDLATAERDYARDTLARVNTKAGQAGIAIFRDKSDWIGKPVKTGEKIMEIADPKRMALRINLPIKDAISLKKGAEVTAFFDADPLSPKSATITQASYQAEPISAEVLAYKIDADFNEQSQTERLRIGWQGTAKIYGERVPLLYFLFRRPLSAARQFIGY